MEMYYIKLLLIIRPNLALSNTFHRVNTNFLLPDGDTISSQIKKQIFIHIMDRVQRKFFHNDTRPLSQTFQSTSSV